MLPAIHASITNFIKTPEQDLLKLADSLQGSTRALESSQVFAAYANSEEPSDDEDLSAATYNQHRHRPFPKKKKDAPDPGRTSNI